MKINNLQSFHDNEQYRINIHMALSSRFLNLLAPGGSGCDFKNAIFKPDLQPGISRSSYPNTIRWMPMDLTDDKSTLVQLTHWGRVMYIYDGKLINLGSDNGLSPGRRQAII